MRDGKQICMVSDLKQQLEVAAVANVSWRHNLTILLPPGGKKLVRNLFWQVFSSLIGCICKSLGVRRHFLTNCRLLFSNSRRPTEHSSVVCMVRYDSTEKSRWPSAAACPPELSDNEGHCMDFDQPLTVNKYVVQLGMLRLVSMLWETFLEARLWWNFW